MAMLTVRNLPDDVHRALRVQAALHGRSTEAEIRSILQNAVKPVLGLGTALAAIGQSVGGVDISFPRDTSPVTPAVFE